MRKVWGCEFKSAAECPKPVLTLGRKASISESYMTQSGKGYVAQKSGTFYDLLPLGCTMFSGCSKLKAVYVSSEWNLSRATSHSNMFKSCTVIEGGRGTAFNSDYVDKTYAVIDSEI